MKLSINIELHPYFKSYTGFTHNSSASSRITSLSQAGNDVAVNTC